MAEFDDKLNSLLSNPEAMDQIMKMARRGRLEPAIRRPVRVGSQLSFRAGKS